MRAVYYQASGGPENLQPGDRPDPVPEAGQMLVRTQAAGVGIWDVKLMARDGGPAPWPRIPGCEVAGTVEVAAAVRDRRVSGAVHLEHRDRPCRSTAGGDRRRQLTLDRHDQCQL